MQKKSKNRDRCDYNSEMEVSLTTHKQVMRKTVEVKIVPIKVQCDQCEFKCLLNIQLKKHKKAVHVVGTDDLKYKCASCKFSSNFMLHIWEHRESNHPNETPNFFPRSKDMALALLAEQNIDIIEEVETLKKSFTGAFFEFVENIGSCMETLRKEVIESSKTNQTVIAQLQ